MLLGIDFGTSYSSAAIFLEGTLYRVKEPLKHGYSFPSSVFVPKSSPIVVGQAAENQRKMDPRRYCHEFKRNLGKNIPYSLGELQLLPEDLVVQMLSYLKMEAEKMTNTLESVVLTIPATYQLYKQELMKEAAYQAGFKEVHLLIEPVAAAIYQSKKLGNKQQTADGEIILVYDLGGGTFDAALLQKQGASYELLSLPVGDEQCGGIDFDRQIFNDVKERMGEELAGLLDGQRQDLEAFRARLSIGDWCREFKHQLSVVSEHEDILPVGDALESYSLTRESLERMIEPFILKTSELCHQLVKSAGLEWSQVSQVLLVGGSCRIPYIQKKLEQEFARPIVRVDEPELAVCFGAALFDPAWNSQTVTQPIANNVEAHNRRLGVYKRLLQERIIFLSGVINDEIAESIITQMLYLESENPGQAIYIYINTPGGSVVAGMAIYDTMQYIKSDVITICVGLAAGIATLLLAAGTKGKRISLSHSRIVITKANAPLNISEELTDIQIAQNISTINMSKIEQIFIQNTNQLGRALMSQTKEASYMSAAEALKYGFIDHIINDTNDVRL